MFRNCAPTRRSKRRGGAVAPSLSTEQDHSRQSQPLARCSIKYWQRMKTYCSTCSGLPNSWFPRAFPLVQIQPLLFRVFLEAIKNMRIKGFWLTIKRVILVNPWNPGGYDPRPITKYRWKLRWTCGVVLILIFLSLCCVLGAWTRRTTPLSVYLAASPQSTTERKKDQE